MQTERSTFLKSVCFDKSCSCRGRPKKMKNVCRVDGAKVATNIVLFSIIHTTQSTGSGGFKKFKV